MGQALLGGMHLCEAGITYKYTLNIYPSLCKEGVHRSQNSGQKWSDVVQYLLNRPYRDNHDLLCTISLSDGAVQRRPSVCICS